MEKDCGYWRHRQHLRWQSPNLNPGSVPAVTGWQSAFQPCANPCINMLSVDEPLRGFGSSELPHLKTSPSTQLPGWFYGLPRHRQALTPIPNPVKEGLSEFPCGGCNGEAPSKVVLRSTEEKRFLVFDQSGNQTSLIYSSLIGSHTQQQPCFGNPTPPFGTCGGVQMVKPVNELVDQIYKARPFFSDGFGENQEIDERSEMHEDTEELNALLYSDDDDDVDDCEDDEMSTGHSPSGLRGHNKDRQEVEGGEEVASSAGPTKRKRLHDNEEQNDDEVASSAGPTKRKRLHGNVEQNDDDDDAISQEWECHEDDAESSCVEGRTQLGEMGCLSSANKRLKREKIRETVSILQSIIPGGQGKDALLVLDEAIQYLRSLKLKVKSWEETL